MFRIIVPNSVVRESDSRFTFSIAPTRTLDADKTITWEIVFQGFLPANDSYFDRITGTLDFRDGDLTTDSQPVAINLTGNAVGSFTKNFAVVISEGGRINDGGTEIDTTELTLTDDDGRASVGDVNFVGISTKNILGAVTTSDGTYSGAGGHDEYVITRYQHGDVTINDTFGANVIKFDYGTTITHYDETARTIRGETRASNIVLTLDTGATVTIASPSGSYSYQIGDGDVRTYTQFREDIGITVSNALTTLSTPFVVQAGSDVATGVVKGTTSTNLLGVGDEDIIGASTDSKVTLSGAGGDDIYVITRHQYGDVTINDTFGANVIKFDYGTTITHYDETARTIRGETRASNIVLTLDTGATVTIASPSGKYSYQIGDGDVRTYTQFRGDIGITVSNALTTLSTPYTVPFPADEPENTPPTRTLNQTELAINEGERKNIATANLEYTDNEQGAGDIQYTLTSDVTNGTLYLNNDTDPESELGNTDTFTQADIDANHIFIKHDGDDSPDRITFTFEVTDKVMGTTPVQGSFSTAEVSYADDAPIVMPEDLTGSADVTEDTMLEGDGTTITFSDDETQRVNMSIRADPNGENLGIVTTRTVRGENNFGDFVFERNNTNGELTWKYVLDNTDDRLDRLLKDEKEVDNLTVRISDGVNPHVDVRLTANITGANEPPSGSQNAATKAIVNAGNFDGLGNADGTPLTFARDMFTVSDDRMPLNVDLVLYSLTGAGGLFTQRSPAVALPFQMGQSFNINDLNNGNFAFTYWHSGNDTAITNSFSFHLRDGDGAQTTDAIDFTIIVNQRPTHDPITYDSNVDGGDNAVTEDDADNDRIKGKVTFTDPNKDQSELGDTLRLELDSTLRFVDGGDNDITTATRTVKGMYGNFHLIASRDERNTVNWEYHLATATDSDLTQYTALQDLPGTQSVMDSIRVFAFDQGIDGMADTLDDLAGAVDLVARVTTVNVNPTVTINTINALVNNVGESGASADRTLIFARDMIVAMDDDVRQESLTFVLTDDQRYGDLAIGPLNTPSFVGQGGDGFTMNNFPSNMFRYIHYGTDILATEDIFKFRIRDADGGLSDEMTDDEAFKVFINQAPTVSYTAPADRTVTEDSEAGDTNVDGNIITFSDRNNLDENHVLLNVPLRTVAGTTAGTAPIADNNTAQDVAGTYGYFRLTRDGDGVDWDYHLATKTDTMYQDQYNKLQALTNNEMVQDRLRLTVYDQGVDGASNVNGMGDDLSGFADIVVNVIGAAESGSIVAPQGLTIAESGVAISGRLQFQINGEDAVPDSWGGDDATVEGRPAKRFTGDYGRLDITDFVRGDFLYTITHSDLNALDDGRTLDDGITLVVAGGDGDSVFEENESIIERVAVRAIKDGVLAASEPVPITILGEGGISNKRPGPTEAATNQAFVDELNDAETSTTGDQNYFYIDEESAASAITMQTNPEGTDPDVPTAFILNNANPRVIEATYGDFYFTRANLTPDTPNTHGTLRWSYVLRNTEVRLKTLDAEQIETDTVVIRLTDEAGEHGDDITLTATIRGANEPTVTARVAPNTDTTILETAGSTTGTLEFSIDGGLPKATGVNWFTPGKAGGVGDHGTLTFNENTYTFTLKPIEDLDMAARGVSLDENESLTQSFRVAGVDGFGNSAEFEIDFTISGEGPAPGGTIMTDNEAARTIAENVAITFGNLSFTLYGGGTPVGSTTWTYEGDATYGEFQLAESTGSWSYEPLDESELDKLDTTSAPGVNDEDPKHDGMDGFTMGERFVDTFMITATDANEDKATYELKIIITGVGSPSAAPTPDRETQRPLSIVNEATEQVITDLILGYTDTDNEASELTYTIVGTAITGGAIWYDPTPDTTDPNNVHRNVDGDELQIVPFVADTTPAQGTRYTFTQDDVDKGYIFFLPTDSTSPSGSFSFTLSDGPNTTDPVMVNLLSVGIGLDPTEENDEEIDEGAALIDGVFTYTVNGVTPGDGINWGGDPITDSTDVSYDGAHGTLRIGTDGYYRYIFKQNASESLNATQDDDGSFDAGDSTTETFAITARDNVALGSIATYVFEITINGVTEPGNMAANFVNVTDMNKALTTDEDLSGETSRNTIEFRDPDVLTTGQGIRIGISGTSDEITLAGPNNFTGGNGHGSFIFTRSDGGVGITPSITWRYDLTADLNHLPAGDMSTTDTITLTITDGAADGAGTDLTLTVTIEGRNDEPVQQHAANQILYVEYDGETVITNTFLNFSDVDTGATLTYTVTRPTNGNVYRDASDEGMALDAATNDYSDSAVVMSFTQQDINENRITFRHDDSTLVQTSGVFSYELSDGGGYTSASTLVDVNFFGIRTTTTDDDRTFAEGTTNNTGNLSFTILGAAPAGSITWTISNAGAGTYGALTVVDGVYTYTPKSSSDLDPLEIAANAPDGSANDGDMRFDTDEKFTETFTITATADGRTATYDLEFTIEGHGGPPTITTPTTTIERQIGIAGDPRDLTIRYFVGDIEDDVETYTAANFTVYEVDGGGNRTESEFFEIFNTAPDGQLKRWGLRIKESLANEPTAGVYNIVVVVTDTDSRTGEITEQHALTLSVNTAPTLAPINPINIIEGTNYELNSDTLKNLVATDREQDDEDLLYKITTAPENGGIFFNKNIAINMEVRQFFQGDLDAGDIEYRPGNATGSFTFTFSVEDGIGGIIENQDLVITITERVTDDDPPVARVFEADIPSGETNVLGDTELLYEDAKLDPEDPDDPENVTYTIFEIFGSLADFTTAGLTFQKGTASSDGQVNFDTPTTLGEGGTFTQEEVNNGLIRIHHNDAGGTIQIATTYYVPIIVSDELDNATPSSGNQVHFFEVDLGLPNTTPAYQAGRANLEVGETKTIIGTNDDQSKRELLFTDDYSDSDEITYTINSIAAGITIQKGVVINVETGEVSFDNPTTIGLNGTFTQADVNGGVVRITHAGSTTGGHSIELTVTDEHGGASSEEFLITVSAPVSPVVASPRSISINDNSNALPAFASGDGTGTFHLSDDTSGKMVTFSIEGATDVSDDDTAFIADRGFDKKVEAINDGTNYGTLFFTEAPTYDSDNNRYQTNYAFRINNDGVDSLAVADGVLDLSFTISATVVDEDPSRFDFNIAITPFNDSPMPGDNTGITLDEGAAGLINSDALSVTDPDTEAANLTYTASALTNGRLELRAADGITVTKTITSASTPADSTFTQDDIDQNRLYFVHDGGNTTSASFGYSVDDGVSGLAPVTGTFNIAVTLLNDDFMRTDGTTQGTTATEANSEDDSFSAEETYIYSDEETAGSAFSIVSGSQTIATTNDTDNRVEVDSLYGHFEFWRADSDTPGEDSTLHWRYVLENDDHPLADHNSETIKDSVMLTISDTAVGDDDANDQIVTFEVDITTIPEPSYSLGGDLAMRATEGGGAVTGKLDYNRNGVAESAGIVWTDTILEGAHVVINGIRFTRLTDDDLNANPVTENPRAIVLDTTTSETSVTASHVAGDLNFTYFNPSDPGAWSREEIVEFWNDPTDGEEVRGFARAEALDTSAHPATGMNSTFNGGTGTTRFASPYGRLTFDPSNDGTYTFTVADSAVFDVLDTTAVVADSLFTASDPATLGNMKFDAGESIIASYTITAKTADGTLETQILTFTIEGSDPAAIGTAPEFNALSENQTRTRYIEDPSETLDLGISFLISDDDEVDRTFFDQDTNATSFSVFEVVGGERQTTASKTFEIYRVGANWTLRINKDIPEFVPPSTQPSAQPYILDVVVTDPRDPNLTDTARVTLTLEDNTDPEVAFSGITVPEGQNYTFNLDLADKDLDASDDEQENSTLVYIITTPPAGTIYNTATRMMTDRFTQAELDAGSIEYRPGETTVSDRFTFSVQDKLGATLTEQIFSITLTPPIDRGDPPTQETKKLGVILNTNTEGQITNEHLSYNDPDGDNDLLTYTVSSVTGGTLWYDPTPNTMDPNNVRRDNSEDEVQITPPTGIPLMQPMNTRNTFTQADIDSGFIFFVGDGSGYGSFLFTVSDEFNTIHEDIAEAFEILDVTLGVTEASVVAIDENAAEPKTISGILKFTYLGSPPQAHPDWGGVSGVYTGDYGTLTITNGSAFGDGDYTYQLNADEADLDMAADNAGYGPTFDDTETLTDTFIIKVEDDPSADFGALTIYHLDITINGVTAVAANVNPSFTQGTDSTEAKDTIHEDHGALGTLSKTIAFTDNDGGDDSMLTISQGNSDIVAGTPIAGSNNFGNFTITELTSVDGTGMGELKWNYSLTADLNYLDDINDTEIDTLTLTVTDEDGGVDSVTLKVTIEGRPDAPTVPPSTSATMDEGGTLDITTVLLSATDPDMPATDTLTYTISNQSNGAIKVGTDTSALTFTQDDIDNDRVSFVHDGSNTTSASFEYSVSDGTGTTAAVGAFSIDVTLLNDDFTRTDGTTQGTTATEANSMDDSFSTEETYIYSDEETAGSAFSIVSGSQTIATTNDTDNRVEVDSLYGHFEFWRADSDTPGEDSTLHWRYVLENDDHPLADHNSETIKDSVMLTISDTAVGDDDANDQIVTFEVDITTIPEPSYSLGGDLAMRATEGGEAVSGKLDYSLGSTALTAGIVWTDTIDEGAHVVINGIRFTRLTDEALTAIPRAIVLATTTSESTVTLTRVAGNLNFLYLDPDDGNAWSRTRIVEFWNDATDGAEVRDFARAEALDTSAHPASGTFNGGTGTTNFTAPYGTLSFEDDIGNYTFTVADSAVLDALDTVGGTIVTGGVGAQVGNEVFDAGESIIASYTITAKTMAGTLESETLTFTIQGVTPQNQPVNVPTPVGDANLALMTDEDLVALTAAKNIVFDDPDGPAGDESGVIIAVKDSTATTDIRAGTTHATTFASDSGYTGEFGEFTFSRADDTGTLGWQYVLSENARRMLNELTPESAPITDSIKLTFTDGTQTETPEERVITVTIAGVNDAPDLTPEGTGRVDENAVDVDTGITFTVADPDVTGRTLLATDFSTDDSRFMVVEDGSGGFKLQIVSAIDYDMLIDDEKANGITFNVTFDDQSGATDGSATDMESVTVMVTNVNDQKPILDGGDMSGNVAFADVASKADFTAITFAPMDPDGLKTSFVAGDFRVIENNVTSTRFFVKSDGGTGFILEYDPTRLDATALMADETANLEVVVSDGTDSDGRAITITTGSAPNYQPSLEEVSTAQVKITDTIKTEADTGLTYRLTDRNVADTHTLEVLELGGDDGMTLVTSTNFGIVAGTGDGIYNLVVLADNTLNYGTETGQATAHNLTIRATDSGSPSMSAEITATINLSEAPTLGVTTSLQQRTFVEVDSNQTHFGFFQFSLDGVVQTGPLTLTNVTSDVGAGTYGSLSFFDNNEYGFTPTKSRDLDGLDTTIAPGVNDDDPKHDGNRFFTEGERFVESFDVMAEDATGNTATYTITFIITGVGTPPFALAERSGSVTTTDEGTNAEGVLDFLVDGTVNNTGVTLSIESGDSTYGTLAFTGERYTYTHKSASELDTEIVGTAFDTNTDGKFGPGETLTESFTVLATDGSNNTARYALTFTIDGVHAPEEVANNSLIFVNYADAEANREEAITQAHLEYIDSDHTPAELTYTVTTINKHSIGVKDSNGNVVKTISSTSMPAESTFTQDDINQGRVFYLHDNTADTDDSFEFTVSDGDGNSKSGTFSFITTTLTASGDMVINEEDSDRQISGNFSYEVLGISTTPALTTWGTGMAGQTFTFNGRYGALRVEADGSYTYRLNYTEEQLNALDTGLDDSVVRVDGEMPDDPSMPGNGNTDFEAGEFILDTFNISVSDTDQGLSGMADIDFAIRIDGVSTFNASGTHSAEAAVHEDITFTRGEQTIGYTPGLDNSVMLSVVGESGTIGSTNTEITTQYGTFFVRRDDTNNEIVWNYTLGATVYDYINGTVTAFEAVDQIADADRPTDRITISDGTDTIDLSVDIDGTNDALKFGFAPIQEYRDLMLPVLRNAGGSVREDATEAGDDDFANPGNQSPGTIYLHDPDSDSTLNANRMITAHLSTRQFGEDDPTVMRAVDIEVKEQGEELSTLEGIYGTFTFTRTDSDTGLGTKIVWTYTLDNNKDDIFPEGYHLAHDERITLSTDGLFGGLSIGIFIEGVNDPAVLEYAEIEGGSPGALANMQTATITQGEANSEDLDTGIVFDITEADFTQRTVYTRHNFLVHEKKTDGSNEYEDTASDRFAVRGTANQLEDFRLVLIDGEGANILQADGTSIDLRITVTDFGIIKMADPITGDPAITSTPSLSNAIELSITVTPAADLGMAPSFNDATRTQIREADIGTAGEVRNLPVTFIVQDDDGVDRTFFDQAGRDADASIFTVYEKTGEVRATEASEIFDVARVNNNWILRIKGGLAAEDEPIDNQVFNLDVVVRDSRDLTGTATVNLTLRENEDPTITTNASFSVEQGETHVFNSGSIINLLAEDADPEDTAANLTYTIITHPTGGTIFNNTIGPNFQIPSFTQNDLNLGRIEYRAGTVETSDSFTFSVRDKVGALASVEDEMGGTTTTITFDITLTATVTDTTAPVASVFAANLARGETNVLDNTELLYIDDGDISDPENVTYEIEDLADFDDNEITIQKGTVGSDGQTTYATLDVGGEFTQKDINDGLVQIVHDGSAVTENTYYALIRVRDEHNNKTGSFVEALEVTLSATAPAPDMSSILPTSESESRTLYEQDPFDATRKGTLDFTNSAGQAVEATAVTWGGTNGVYTSSLGGTLTIDADGDYIYERPGTAATPLTDADGNSLDFDESVTDSFTITAHETADSTSDAMGTLEFTINGLSDVSNGTDNTDELIQGGNGANTITTGSGRDVVIGGEGGDTITLGAGEKTLVHRISSNDTSDWHNEDGADTINGFKRGTDKLVFVDVDTAPDSAIGSLGDFISGAVTKGVSFRVNFGGTDNKFITGITFYFDEGDSTDSLLTLNYATSIEAITAASTLEAPVYTTDGEELLGAAGAGYTRAADNLTGELTDTTLLQNYFDGEDNLDVIALADLDIDIL